MRALYGTVAREVKPSRMSAAQAAGHRHISLRINFCGPRGFGEKPVTRAGRDQGYPQNVV
jgi:hypothetical protein